METTKLIHGSEKVVEALGGWPGFHDAEVISFSASRALPLNANSPVANLCVHVRQYAEVGVGTADYELAVTKSVLVNFSFVGLSDIHIRVQPPKRHRLNSVHPHSGRRNNRLN